MSYLFLHCSVYKPVFPGLKSILSELDGTKALICPQSMAEQQPEVFELFDHVMTVPGNFLDFAQSGLVEQKVFAFHREHRIHKIISTGEAGILRAARLREALRIDGQNLDSALAFRDKLTMVEKCREAGIRVPATRLVSSPADILAFAQVHGFPLVIKPRAGSGSINVHIIADSSQLGEYLGAMKAETFGLGTELLIQEFIDGQLYHVNGFVHSDGSIGLSWPCCYVENGNVDIMRDNETFCGVYLLGPDSPHIEPMNAFTAQCIGALHTPGAGFAFHLELFIDKKANELVFCEVASRQGGGRITDIFSHGFGICLLEATVRLQAGLDVSVSTKIPEKLIGNVDEPTRNGTLQLLTNEPLAYPWILESINKMQSGDAATGPSSAVDTAWSTILAAGTQEELENRIQILVNWRKSVANWIEC